MAFNIQGAVQSLIARSSASSQHMCAKFVRMAMESGGLSTATRPNWAWKYISWLPSQGWSLVGTVNTNEAQAEFTKSVAKPGDIAVYQKPGAGQSQPGHICMYSGSQWISDFRQNRMGVYSSQVQAYVFRYTGEISNAPIDISGLDGFGDGGAGSPGGFAELNSQTLAAKCPEHIEFKGMWMRYQLQAGEKSPTMREFMNNAGGAYGDIGGNIDISGIPNDLGAFICKNEGWYDHRCKHGYGTYGTDAMAGQAGIDRNGVITVGPGLTNAVVPIQAGQIYSAAQINEWFKQKLQKNFIEPLLRANPNIESIGQGAFMAAVSFLYNCGAGKAKNFANCTTKEQVSQVCANGPIRANGKVLEGLVRRRKEEAALALT